ncbi:MAG: bacillithiol biosynthesis deacetylase BshB1 [Candidatus Bathyarchaeota archaeon]|nr:bacillithiol biosynthesis deacetylase BshB1 [Candidatus Bathyarchaeota archaeon]MDH5494610.1 bacillithiol biosynthesis deacetylase BshB1 [Candidatus Bathyarchaeota archaeon]
MLDILAISPHPDDVELCCGGLIAKMGSKGYRIGIVDLTKGELGTEGTADIRMQEATKAADLLGVQIRENMDFGDCRVSSGFDEAKKLAGVIRQYIPSLLIAPYGDDHHPDHAASRKLVDKAVFFAKLSRVRTDNEVHQVKMVTYYMLHKSFVPSFIVDVTQSHGKKLEAIKAYKSQIGLMLGMEGLLKSTELRDQIYGSRVGVKYGEPFFCNTPLMIDDPVVFSK